MRTRQALKTLTKGKIDNTGVVGPLYAAKDKFLAQFEAREASIEARKNAEVLNVPALVALRNKVAAEAGTPERETPVAMRFYAHQAVKAASLRQPKDRGLAMLARHLEKIWHEDPMGSLTLGQVSDLRQHYADSYPTSKVAKVMDKEIKRVGYSNLPVAKLARIAAKINDQADFDNAVMLAGLAGDRQDQISARTLIRNLVEARGASLEPVAAVADDDDRTTAERAADRVAQFMDDPEAPPVGLPAEEAPMDGVLMPGDEEVPPMEQEFPLETGAPATEPEMDEFGQVLEQVDQATHEIVQEAPPEAASYIEEESAEHPGVEVPSMEWAFDEGAEGNHSAPPPSKEWQAEELAEHGKGPDMGMELDLPPVDDGVLEDEFMPMGEMPISAVLDAEGKIVREDGGYKVKSESGKNLSKTLPSKGAAEKRLQQVEYFKHKGQLETSAAPMVNRVPNPTFKSKPDVGDAVFRPGQRLGPDVTAPQEPSMVPGDNTAAIRQLEEAVRTKRITPGQYRIEREKLERMGCYDTHPVMAPKAGENVNEYETAEQAVSHAMGGEKMAGKGMDASKPPKDGQYPRKNNYAPERGKDGGAELNKDETRKKAQIPVAAEVEAAILDRGNAYRVGNVVIFVNDNDEVELHNKSGARACSIKDIDVAISDFIKEAAAELPEEPKQLGQYIRVSLVPVPCARCAEVLHFEATADANDIYECTCGHRTKASTINSLVKLGQLQKMVNYTVKMPPEVAQNPETKRMFHQLLANLQKETGAQVAPRGEFMFDIHTTNTDPQNLRTIQAKLRQMGIAQFNPSQGLSQGSKTAQFDPGPVVPAGGADQAMPPDQASTVVPASQPGAAASPAAQPGAAPAMEMNPESVNARVQWLMKYADPKPSFFEAIDIIEKEVGKGKMPQELQLLVGKVVLDNMAQTQPTAGAPPAPPPTPVQASVIAFLKKEAEGKMVVPKVLSSHPAKQKSSTEMGKDTEQDKGFKEPAVKVKHPAKQHSPTNMGKDTEGKETPAGMNAPKPPKDGHVPGKAGDQPGTKPVPGKSDLGKDSDTHGEGIPLPSKPKSSLKAKK